MFFFCKAEDGIRDLVRSRGLGDVYKRQVLEAGTPLNAAAIGLLATVGAADVPVFPWPRAAILATGDELVICDAIPGPGQIRNSNGPLLILSLIHI